jgi:hypothetical protein
MPDGRTRSRRGLCPEKRRGAASTDGLPPRPTDESLTKTNAAATPLKFEPILFPYLEVIPTGFRIRTAYSRTVVDELRRIPFARWNGDDKVWEVSYASYDDLQHRWEAIEAAAKRAEPEERRKRAEARKGTEEEAKAKRRMSERRKKRLPVSSDDLSPRDRPDATATYGIVVITKSLANSSTLKKLLSIIRMPTTSMSGQDGGPPHWTNSFTPGRRRASRENTSGSRDGGSRRLKSCGPRGVP